MRFFLGPYRRCAVPLPMLLQSARIVGSVFPLLQRGPAFGGEGLAGFSRSKYPRTDSLFVRNAESKWQWNPVFWCVGFSSQKFPKTRWSCFATRTSEHGFSRSCVIFIILLIFRSLVLRWVPSLSLDKGWPLNHVRVSGKRLGHAYPLGAKVQRFFLESKIAQCWKIDSFF